LTASAGLIIRPWHDSDTELIDTLLDDSADRVWIEQFHRLHGPDQQQPAWRR
jgi:hypothetical protein